MKINDNVFITTKDRGCSLYETDKTYETFRKSSEYFYVTKIFSNRVLITNIKTNFSMWYYNSQVEVVKSVIQDRTYFY